MKRIKKRKATRQEQYQATHALIASVIELGEAGTDDAHARYELPPSVDQRAWGSVTMRVIADGVLRRVGDTHTRRAVAHGRRIGRYVAPDIEYARQYRDRLAADAANARPAQRSLFDHVAGDN